MEKTNGFMLLEPDCCSLFEAIYHFYFHFYRAFV